MAGSADSSATGSTLGGWATIEAGRHALPSGKRAAHTRAADAAALPLPDIDTSAAVITTADRAVEVLATFAAPRIVVLGNVLSAEECDALIEYCEPRLARSPVIASAEGDVRLHENRTSTDAPLRRGETAIVARIEERLAALARWPAEYGEGLQVVRYDAAQEYRAHCDWFDPDQPGLRKHLERGGQRLGTFVLYLSGVESPSIVGS